MDWFKLLWRGLQTVGSLAGVALGLLYILQEKIIYVPRLPGIPSDYPYLPDAFGLEYEDLWLTTSDGVRLHAWIVWPRHWQPEQRAQRPLVAFFQENAGNMAFRLPFLKSLTRSLDCSAFILSYRGYGRSQGSPTERGLQLDAQAAMDALLARPEVHPSRLLLFGRSLGGAVAAHAAAANKGRLAGLVLENTFASMEETVGAVMPWLGLLIGPGRPANRLLRNKWNTRAAVRHLTDTPTLFLSSLRDEMLPPWQMRALYDTHPAPPWQLVCFPDAGHMDAFDSAAHHYWPALQAFVEALVPQQTRGDNSGGGGSSAGGDGGSSGAGGGGGDGIDDASIEDAKPSWVLVGPGGGDEGCIDPDCSHDQHHHPHTTSDSGGLRASLRQRGAS